MRLCEGDVQGAREMDCKVVLVVVPSAAITRAVERSRGPGRPSRASTPPLGNPAGWVHREASGCPGTQDRALPKWEKTFWAPHVQGCPIRTAGAVLDWMASLIGWVRAVGGLPAAPRSPGEVDGSGAVVSGSRPAPSDSLPSA